MLVLSLVGALRKTPRSCANVSPSSELDEYECRCRDLEAGGDDCGGVARPFDCIVVVVPRCIR